MASNNNNLDGEACLNYYESYIDFTEHLSLEMQKDLSRIKELDVTYKGNFLFRYSAYINR